MTPRIGCLLNRLLVVCLCWLGSLSSCGLYVSLRTVCLFSLLRLCGPVDCVSGGFGTVCPRGLGICMRSVWLVIQYLADFVSAMLVVAKKKKSCCSELQVRRFIHLGSQRVDCVASRCLALHTSLFSFVLFLLGCPLKLFLRPQRQQVRMCAVRVV